MKRKELQLYEEIEKKADEVLHYLWDPIGVAGVPEARNEYEMYVSQICGMLIRENRKKGSVANRLGQIESESMGEVITERMKETNQRVEEILVDWTDFLKEKIEPNKSLDVT